MESQNPCHTRPHAVEFPIRPSYPSREYLDGQELTEGLLNHIEVAIRAYDPCLSCATHALGKMPLEVSLLGPQGELIDRILRSGAGDFLRP